MGLNYFVLSPNAIMRTEWKTSVVLEFDLQSTSVDFFPCSLGMKLCLTQILGNVDGAL